MNKIRVVLAALACLVVTSLAFAASPTIHVVNDTGYVVTKSRVIAYTDERWEAVGDIPATEWKSVSMPTIPVDDLVTVDRSHLTIPGSCEVIVGYDMVIDDGNGKTSSDTIYAVFDTCASPQIVLSPTFEDLCGESENEDGADSPE